MSKTKRNQPTSRNARRDKLARSWETQVEQFKEQHAKPPVQPPPPAPPAKPKGPVAPPQTPPSPRQIEVLKAEAEALIAQKAEPGGQNFSRQDPLPGQAASGNGLILFSNSTLEAYIPLTEHGTKGRQEKLRAFALCAPMILIAESVLIKKMQALQWSIEAGRNRAIHWQETLAGLEQNRGWDTFIGKWTRAYCESDFGGYAEIIRDAPGWATQTVTSVGNGYGEVGVRTGTVLSPRGEQAILNGKDRTWPIADARVMDPVQCIPTGDPEFPLQYSNSYTGKKYFYRPYQFMHILDMPSVDDSKPNQGLCAVSRAVWAAQEDRMVTRYGFEALSENPGTGMILANVNENLLRTALASAKGARDSRGVVYYKGLIFLPILDPSGNTKLEYLTFSHLPEGFNRTEDYSRIKEIVASAFGMDVLELGSIPGHNLGTSAQAEVGAAKARGKGIGALIQSVEREFRHKFLPDDVQLRIKKHDIDEQKDRAELDNLYFSMATSMVQVGAWDPVLANQYLADQGAIQSEFPFLAEDLTPSEEMEDTEATAKRIALDGPPCIIDRWGKVTWKQNPYVQHVKDKAAQTALRFDVDEKLEALDMVGASALWDKHLPEHRGMTR